MIADPNMAFVRQLAVRAGRELLRLRTDFDSTTVEFKNDRDLVTVVDRELEAFIINEIHTTFPDHSIVGEETGRTDGSSDYRWIIDPIDGTTSFVHDLPFYSISIALQKNDKTIAAAVNAPTLGELFTASIGHGAFLNDAPIHVSTRPNLISSLLATGFACLRAQQTPNNLANFNRIAPKIRGIRRMGSAALDLAYVAAGRLDGFWEIGLQPYDVAAGILLVQEAGGRVTDFAQGSHVPKLGTLATNNLIHDALADLLDRP